MLSKTIAGGFIMVLSDGMDHFLKIDIVFLIYQNYLVALISKILLV